MGRVCGGGGYPTVAASVVSPACGKIDRRHAAVPAPYDHFAPGPHRRVIDSWRGRVDCGGKNPTVCAWVISAASVQPAATATSDSTPDDHLAASPNCGMRLSGKRGVDRAGGRPGIAGWIVSAPRVQIAG